MMVERVGARLVSSSEPVVDVTPMIGRNRFGIDADFRSERDDVHSQARSFLYQNIIFFVRRGVEFDPMQK